MSKFSPSTPAITQPDPLPTRDDPAIAAAANEQRQAALRRRGRRASILTSGEGVTDELGAVASGAPGTRKAQVLGQAAS